MKICESCGMPLEKKETSKHDEKYCIYCQNKDTGELKTYEKVRKGSIGAAMKLMDKTKEESEKMAEEMLPKLPRWIKQ